MSRHAIGSGFFCEAGVKKFETAFSSAASAIIRGIKGGLSESSLFTLDSTFRRSGGGEIARVGEATLFTPPSDILKDLLSASSLTAAKFELRAQ